MGPGELRERPLGAPADLPDPAGELAGDRDVGDAGPLAGRPEGFVPPAEARGGVVAAPLHGRRHGRAGRRRLGPRRARLEVPRRLDEGAPGGGVPGLGDAAFGLLLAARVLGGRKAEPGGVGAGGGEPGEAPRLGGQAERRDGVCVSSSRFEQNVH